MRAARALHPLRPFRRRRDGGDSIFDGDLLVIERLGDYSQGQIVFAFVEGQRLEHRSSIPFRGD
jgi:hypothetical protein